MRERPFKAAADHYDEAYFEVQSQDGEVLARLQRFMFADHVMPSDCVIEFGCGGGYMLRELGVARPIGVDINPAAQDVAKRNGIAVHARLDEIEDGIADAVISCHALEHVENPLEELRQMNRKLKPNGKLVLVVPCDAPSLGFSLSDRDFHLFSWSASNIGNLARCAGFDVITSHELRHRVPPKWQTIYNRLGFEALEFAANLSRILPLKRRQVHLVARKATPPDSA